MAKRKTARKSAARGGTVSRRRVRTRAARTTPRRSVGNNWSDSRLLGLATKVIKEDEGLLRRLAER